MCAAADDHHALARMIGHGGAGASIAQAADSALGDPPRDSLSAYAELAWDKLDPDGDIASTDQGMPLQTAASSLVSHQHQSESS